MTTVILISAIAVGLYMAWNIGANDVANAMGTSVGSGALTLRQAVILAGIFEFLGALIVGGSVAETIRKGIVDMDALRRSASPSVRAPAEGPTSRPRREQGAPTPGIRAAEAGPAVAPAEEALRTRVMLGMLSALLAAALWLNVATFFSQPVSTTHAIIGAVVGFAIVEGGPGSVVWSKMGRIAASWVISPIVGGAVAFFIYRCIQRFVLRDRDPVAMAKRAVPLCFGLVAFVLTISILFKVCHVKLNASGLLLCVSLALLLAMATTLVARFVLLRRAGHRQYAPEERYQVVEKWFGRIQPVNACYKAFAHGANDVANAIGPLAAIFHMAGGGALDSRAPVPLWLLVLGGVGIVVGLATYGYKVIDAIGKKITEITPTRGFGAEFATASTVLVCSLMGLPISTTFVLVGAVMGVGLARGFGAIDMKVIRKIFASWLITIPVSAVFAAVIYKLLMCLV
ncbi:MAG TPA: inorganic phosphate transporter [Phycisphaerae bacterium]|nr:inorganic phosphate transporter [Phycisphaerae bacterium]